MTDYIAIGVDEAIASLARFDTIIDVRAEVEFAEDHLPGAINCPVLNDAERAEIGTLDKQVSPFDARRRGAAIVSRNIARLLEEQFADRPRDWKPLVYCWRGGQRSGSLSVVMQRVGWQVRRLEGGYKEFRRAVRSELETLPANFKYRVVVGPTGSGKSRLLTHLRAAGVQVLDLEQLAEHRGSVLGGLPEQAQPSQKAFETRVWSALRGFDPHRPIYVESESKKVGNLRVPEPLIERMRASPCLSVELPLAARIALLREEYRHFEENTDALFAPLDCLLEMHGREKIGAWKQLALAGKWDEFVERLLVEHYDPAYQRSIRRNFSELAVADVLALESGNDAAFVRAASELAARL
ncbi:MAG: tRNA 2-selenouridine(34) synthase MnmH [Burkholderiaceae bacterium]